RRNDAGRARRIGRHAAGARRGRDCLAGRRRHGDGRHDREAARVRARARRRSGRCGDCGRTRRRGPARGGGRRVAGTGHTHHCGAAQGVTAARAAPGRSVGRPSREGGSVMTMVMDDVVAREARHVLQTYRRQPVTFVRGQGVRLYDADGREYIDLLSGIGVAALGHAHKGLARAISDQSDTLIHTSNLFFHPLQGQLAERLANLSGLPRAFFCNSGAEAVEACLKFARRYWFGRGEERTEIIALEGSFHGRTFGSLSVTSDEHYRTPFAPLLSGIRFIPATDRAALVDALSRHTAAIIVEPIQGEGGVRPLTAAFAAAITEGCEKTGALLICDEVQSGLGRTGYLFYFAAL